MTINKEKTFISAVVYLSNNEINIKSFLESLTNILNNNFEKYEIICVNDASSDNTCKAIIEFAKSKPYHSAISIINMSYKQGLEPSMNAGIDLAIGDFVYEFDNTYIDYDVNIILDIYKHLFTGFDIVNASPANIKNKSSKLFYNIFNKFSNFHYNLTTESFRILSRRAINRINSISKTIPYRKAVYANCGMKMDTISYAPVNENAYNIKMKSTERKKVATNSLILFTDIAYKLSIFMTIFMMFATILSVIYTLFIFINRNPIAGWTTTMLFLSVSFCFVFIILAIVIKYLSIIVDLIFKNKKYIIESIEKINN